MNLQKTLIQALNFSTDLFSIRYGLFGLYHRDFSN